MGEGRKEGRRDFVAPNQADLLLRRRCLPQLDGTLVAPTNSKAWGTGLLQWLEFTKLKGITIRGKGVIEGRGAVWWSQSQFEYEPVSSPTLLPSCNSIAAGGRSLTTAVFLPLRR